MHLAFQPFHPTNLTTHRHPVDRWFNFIAGFSPEFVSSCIAKTMPVLVASYSIHFRDAGQSKSKLIKWDFHP